MLQIPSSALAVNDAGHPDPRVAALMATPLRQAARVEALAHG